MNGPLSTTVITYNKELPVAGIFRPDLKVSGVGVFLDFFFLF